MSIVPPPVGGVPLPSRALALEGAAVETAAGLIFTVKGVVHPPERVVAYLRYVPDPHGDRVREGRRYRRVYSIAEQEAALRERGLSYRYDDPALGVPIDAVPWQDVTRVYDPRQRLGRLRDEGPEDPLTQAALALTQLLRAAAEVPATALGVTGSLLFDLQNAASDIDLVVYGDDACRKVHAALGLLLEDPTAGVSRPSVEELAAIHAAHRKDTPLSAADFRRMQAGKVNEGRFAGRPFFMRFVKLPAEVPERWGDPRYAPLGQALIEARVGDASDALFTPCRYALAQARPVERTDELAGGGATVPGPQPAGTGAPPLEGAAALTELISFRGRFADQARAGEWVRARGALECVVWRGRPVSTRLVVGGCQGDYLLGLEGVPTPSVLPLKPPEST